MKINPKTHCLENITYIPSPNYSERPENTVIDLLVIHGISLPPGEFGGSAITALFTNSLDPNEHPSFNDIHHLKVSAHLLIQRNGETIQYVPFNQQAWHAGVSSFKGREACNDFSIGIELEGTDEHAYESAQYQQLLKVTKALMMVYPAITADRIVGHSDIAPGRKTDPGPSFDWDYYLNELQQVIVDL